MQHAQHDHPPLTTYEMDATSPTDILDHSSGSEDERLIDRSRNTLDLKDYDSLMLREEEDRDSLLTRNGPFAAMRRMVRGSPNHVGYISSGAEASRQRRKQRSSSRRGVKGESAEEGQLMFEMEEGYNENSSRSPSLESLRLGRHKWARHEEKRPYLTWRWFILVPFVIIALFLLLASGAYNASSSFRHAQLATTLSNGSHAFAATTILISLDGFRADFLDLGLTPTLNAFIASGISPRYMLPSFPSVTFPNHFTFVTGLYPESHGVVGNSFWDPDLEEEFFYTDPLRSLQPKWWNAEPLWVTAESQGIRTAVHMWPGSEAHLPPLEPTYLDKFNGTEALLKKVERILGLLDLPSELDASEGLSSDRRPQLIAAYVPNVDSEGHKHGPNSTVTRDAVSDVDSMLSILMDGLYDRNLTEVVNVVIVSDHGMATTSNTRLVQLDDLIDLSLVEHIDGWPLFGLRLRNSSRDASLIYEQLLEQSKQSQGFDVYNLDTMPERYHFTNNKRIAPLWIVPRTGWAVVAREDFDVVAAQAAGNIYHPLGLHGYDPEHPLMRAIFVARGPAFPHPPNSRVPIFQNIEVYNIICDSLGIKPHANNGSLRLPLETDGFHGDEDTPASEMSLDEEVDKQKDGAQADWWKFMHDRILKVKDWAKKIIENLSNHDKDG